jgi:uncharacterized lipoprotein YmbA
MKHVLPTIGFLALALASCSHAPEAKSKYFALDPGKPVSLQALQSITEPVSASATYVHVSAPFASDGFVYQVSPYQWDVDAYNQFLVPPSDMLTSILRSWLRDAGFPASLPESKGKDDRSFVIDCRVTEFYGDFRNLAAPRAVLSMDVQITRKTPQGPLTIQKSLTKSVAVSQRTPGALVDAWNEALRAELTEILRVLGSEIH